MNIKKQIKNKLIEQSGVSLSFALIFFIVATMVSLTIISAATTAVARVQDDKAQQQAQLTLDSAAKLLREGMKNTSCQVKEEITYNEDKTIQSKTVSVVEGSTNGALKDLVSDAMLNVVTYGAVDNTIGEFTITLSDDNVAAAMQLDGNPVKVTYKMIPPSIADDAEEVSKRYDMYMTLTLTDEKGNTYTTNLYADSDPKETGSSSTDETNRTKTSTYTVSWKDFTITSF